MRIVTTYIANDGTEFHTQIDCVEYEEKQRDKEFKNTAFLFNQYGEQLKITGMGFEQANFILAKTDEAAQYLFDKFSGYITPWDRGNNAIVAGCWFFDGQDWIPVREYIRQAEVAKRILSM